MDNFDSSHERSLKHRLWHKLVGEPRNINEPSLFHKISLIPILAWIGLGADGFDLFERHRHARIFFFKL